MTYWIVQADYRPLTDLSPKYAFLAESGRTAKSVEKAFRKRYDQLQNIKVQQLTEQEMECDPIHQWIMWI